VVVEGGDGESGGSDDGRVDYFGTPTTITPRCWTPIQLLPTNSANPLDCGLSRAQRGFMYGWTVDLFLELDSISHFPSSSSSAGGVLLKEKRTWASEWTSDQLE